MKKFEKNIINLYGEIGKEWLKSLPIVIEKLSEHWQLTNIKSVENINWNFVALAIKDGKQPVVLKISCDKDLIQDEYNTLKHFGGNGAINAIDINTVYNALLLEQAIPGYLLKDHHPSKIEDTINIYASIVKKISNHQLPVRSYTNAREWCKALDRIRDPQIPKHFIQKANHISSELFNTPQYEYLCHGDLHLENIIQSGCDWVAIDPKGIIGEIAFEASAFDLISKDEMEEVTTVSSKIINRIRQLSKALNIDFNRLISWIFLRVIISAQWFIEDKGDPSQMLKLAHFIYTILHEDADDRNVSE